jgi:hypothetical protein
MVHNHGYYGTKSGLICRGATATKASKARALPKFLITVNPISTRGADYAHHNTMGLVWLKFAVAPLVWVLISAGMVLVQW